MNHIMKLSKFAVNSNWQLCVVRNLKLSQNVVSNMKQIIEMLSVNWNCSKEKPQHQGSIGELLEPKIQSYHAENRE